MASIKSYKFQPPIEDIENKKIIIIKLMRRFREAKSSNIILL